MDYIPGSNKTPASQAGKERALLFAEGQCRNHHLAILREINQAITSESDLRTILDLFLEKIDSLLPYSAATVRLLNTQSGQLEPVACRNINDAEWKKEMWNAGGLARAVLESKAPLISSNPPRDPRTTYHEFFRKYRFLCYVGIPMITKGEPLGVLSLYMKERHQLSKEEVDFLTTLAGQASVAIHNSQLYEQMERTAHQLSALYTVTATASESLDLDTILKEVIKKITEIFNFDYTRIVLFNPKRDELHLRASFETNPEFFAKYRILRRGQGNVGMVAETGEPIIFEDVQSDPRYQELSQTKTTRRAGFSFLAVFPIKSKVRTEGAIVCLGQKPRQLSPSEIQLITSLTNQIHVAIENANLFEETKSKAKESSALYSVATVLNRSLDITSVLSTLMHKVLEIFAFDAARVYLLDEEGKELRLLARQGIPDNIAVPKSYQPGEEIMGKVLETGKPLIFEDIQKDAELYRLSPRKMALPERFRSHFFLPIAVKGKTVGVMNFFSTAAHRFTPSEVQLIDAIANHIGMAVETASLHEQVKMKSQQLEALVKIIRGIASLLDRDVLLPRIGEEATKLLNMHCASFRLVEGKHIELRYSTHGESVSLRPRLRLGESLTGRVIEENRVVAIRNVLDEPSLIEEHQETMRKAGYRAYLGIPLRVGSRVIGAINLQSKEEREFSEEEISLMSAFADQAAIAIENARLYENLKQSQSLMLRQDRLSSLGMLTAGLAHEIRNPLVAIRTFTQLLPERYGDPEFREGFKTLALKEVDRICGLVTDLLSFARPSTPNVSAEDVNEIVESITRILETEAKEKDVTINLRLGTRLPKIFVDKEQIKQVCMNIILNAIQSIEGGGVVDISTRLFAKDGCEQSFQVEVRDTGTGIPERDLENIFNPFFTTRKDGSGLGLPISHQIVQEHGGYMAVASKVGEGTTFLINLPASQVRHRGKDVRSTPWTEMAKTSDVRA